MAFLGHVAANDILISSLLSAFTCSDLGHLEMVSASVLAELSSSQHWVKYFERTSHVRLGGECLAVLLECTAPQRPEVKALLCKLATLAAPREQSSLPKHLSPVVIGPLSDVQKLAKKLEAAEHKAGQARKDGLATTDVMIRCFQFTHGSVSSPISFHLAGGPTTSQKYMLQLGWTKSDDVVLKVIPQDARPDDQTQDLLSISISTIGAGLYFASRDSIVTADERWWSTNGICTTLSGHDLLKRLFAGLWCVVCICRQPDDAPEPPSSRATPVLESLSLQRPESDTEPAFT